MPTTVFSAGLEEEIIFHPMKWSPGIALFHPTLAIGSAIDIVPGAWKWDQYLRFNIDDIPKVNFTAIVNPMARSGHTRIAAIWEDLQSVIKQDLLLSISLRTKILHSWGALLAYHWILVYSHIPMRVSALTLQDHPHIPEI